MSVWPGGHGEKGLCRFSLNLQGKGAAIHFFICRLEAKYVFPPPSAEHAALTVPRCIAQACPLFRDTNILAHTRNLHVCLSTGHLKKTPTNHFSDAIAQACPPSPTPRTKPEFSHSFETQAHRPTLTPCKSPNPATLSVSRCHCGH